MLRIIFWLRIWEYSNLHFKYDKVSILRGNILFRCISKVLFYYNDYLKYFYRIFQRNGPCSTPFVKKQWHANTHPQSCTFFLLDWSDPYLLIPVVASATRWFTVYTNFSLKFFFKLITVKGIKERYKSPKWKHNCSWENCSAPGRYWT